MKLFLQSLLLIFSFTLVFIWQNTLLSQYTIQILGFLIFLFILVSARKKHIDAIFDTSWGIFILSTVILLFIFSTGGFTSALFFLLYFLGFGIAFAFEPGTVFIFALGVILIFSPLALKADTARNIVMLASFAIISPLSYFFGKEYRKSEKQEEQIEQMKERSKDAAETIVNDIETVLKEEKKTLKSEDVEKLNNILEETETMREETRK